MNNKRYYIIDVIRGVCILLVVLYHFIYDITYIFPMGINFISSRYMDLFRDFFVGVIIFISGISCNFSRNNVKRGVKILVIALVISFVTYFFDGLFISFGILHFFGVTLICYGYFMRFLKKIPDNVGIGLFLLLFFILYIYNPTVSENYGNILFFILGITPDYLFSSDYYPLIPWAFLIFSGSYFGSIMRKGDKKVYYFKVPVLTEIGKRTLPIYILHQPVILASLFLINKALIRTV